MKNSILNIANQIRCLARLDKKPITINTLQKIMYIYHGVKLANGESPIDEPFADSGYAPEIVSLRYEFECAGAKPLKEIAYDNEMVIHMMQENIDKVLIQIWNKFKDLPYQDLFKLVGSSEPYQIAKVESKSGKIRRGISLSNKSIKEHFKENLHLYYV